MKRKCDDGEMYVSCEASGRRVLPSELGSRCHVITTPHGFTVGLLEGAAVVHLQCGHVTMKKVGTLRDVCLDQSVPSHIGKRKNQRGEVLHFSCHLFSISQKSPLLLIHSSNIH